MAQTAERYRYRCLPCTLGGQPATHSVCGEDRLLRGGGVLEWCYSLEDAQAVYAEMKQYPHQFPRLTIRDAEDRLCPTGEG